VNAVNLLPAKHRPRTPTGGQQGSSYIVIGVLGAALLMVLLYAVTVNGINSKKASVARAKAETAQAQKRAAELAPYGNFTQVKEQRVTSVKGLATGRIDWERLARGLAHVLPENVWLLDAKASAGGNADGSGSAPAAPPAAAPPANGGGGGGEAPAPSAAPPAAPAAEPEMILQGCAPDHGSVAVTLVRLRHLPAVTDVELVKATKPVEAAETPAGGGAPGAPAGGTSDNCGTVKKKAVLNFEIKVSFKAQPGSEVTQPNAKPDKVPTSLGGGA
jgi:hypothetical protein